MLLLWSAHFILPRRLHTPCACLVISSPYEVYPWVLRVAALHLFIAWMDGWMNSGVRTISLRRKFVVRRLAENSTWMSFPVEAVNSRRPHWWSVNRRTGRTAAVSWQITHSWLREQDVGKAGVGTSTNIQSSLAELGTLRQDRVEHCLG